MDNNYIFTADLVAFVEKQDLPPSLYSFVKSASWKDDTKVEIDTRFIVFKIRGTVDSCHAIIINHAMNIEQVENKIQKDLGPIRLSNETRKTLKELLEKFRRGEFAYFLNHKVNNEKYPYRH